MLECIEIITKIVHKKKGWEADKDIMKKRILFVIASVFLGVYAHSQSAGEKAFKSNKPAEAIALLESEIAAGTVSSESYNYLGLAYFQTGDFDRSIDAFERGMKDGRAGKKLLYFNEGNVFFAKGDYSKAENCFSFVQAASPDYFPALLNRANARLNLKKYQEASEDYKSFLLRNPENPQKEAIEKLLGYLDEEIKSAEIIPIRGMHYKLPVLGFRFGKIAYCTDMNYIPEEEFEKLHDLDHFVINCVKHGKHISCLYLRLSLKPGNL